MWLYDWTADTLSLGVLGGRVGSYATDAELSSQAQRVLCASECSLAVLALRRCELLHSMSTSAQSFPDKDVNTFRINKP